MSNDKNLQTNLNAQQVAPMVVVPKVGDTITLLEALGILWQRKYVLLLFIVVGAIVGVSVGKWIRPQFTSDALLQVNIKGNKSSKALGEMGALLDVYSPADAEIELVKSRMVLGNVVEEEHLCYKATPTSKLDRFLHREGRMDLELLQIPETERAGRWTAKAVSDDGYAVFTPEHKQLAVGKVGDLVTANYGGDTLKILVSRMHAKPGQEFALGQMTPLNAARALSRSLSVSEKGKQTGVIAVSYSNRYPDRAAKILNSVANTYVRQNVEMRSAEAEKSLEFLESQLPGVKMKLDTAEALLADYRHSIGSVDMTGETRAHLEKEMDLQKQILQLEQQRQQATRLFKEEHPTVRTIVKQQDKLRAELARLKKNAETMPLTQQEVMRLQEDVQVNNAIYTTMLNNIQQLRVVRAGEVGNVRIVDRAQIESRPSKPKKFNIFICSVAAFFMFGVLLVFLQRMMQSGVRSSLEVERATEVSVLAKIPQSKSAVLKGHKHLRKGVPYALEHPEDIVSESFRSLFTALDFSIGGMDHKVIMVTGLIPGVGKSFVSLNLAGLLADEGKRVLIIDGDMRRGVVFKKARFGLAEVLAGKATLDTAVVPFDIDNLFALAAGKTNSVASKLLRGDAMKQLLEEARQQYDVVIVDTPPLSLVTDAELIYPYADFSLFVLHYGKHRMDDITETMTKIKRYADKPCAFVLNHCQREPGHYYGYNYGYGYGYGHRHHKH